MQRVPLLLLAAGKLGPAGDRTGELLPASGLVTTGGLVPAGELALQRMSAAGGQGAWGALGWYAEWGGV